MQTRWIDFIGSENTARRESENANAFLSPPDNEVAITDLPFPASPKPIVLKGGEAVIDADVFVALIEALSATVKT